MHLESPTIDRRLDGGQQPAVVDRAQGMKTVAGLSNDSVGVELREVAEQVGRDERHVAGDDQDAFGVGRGHCSEQAAERAGIGNLVGQIAAADDRHIADRLANLIRDVFQQRFSVPGQQRLVETHAGAATAREHKAGYAHEKMLTVPGWNKAGILCLMAAFIAVVPAHAESKKLVVRADKRTGKLRAVTVSTVLPPAAKPTIDIAKMVDDAAKANNVDPLLVHSVIQVESNYNPFAVSSAGARGLMQLMPGTAKELGVRDTFDPQQNIEAGVKYLKYLKDLYQDDRLALAAYNAGPGAVQKYKSVPPYPETRDYVQRVGERYEDARRAAGIAPAVALKAAASDEPQAPVVVPTEEKHPRLEQYFDEYGRLHLRTVAD